MTEAIPPASRSSRSVEDIASYLSNNVTAEAWKEGWLDDDNKLSDLAKTVKEAWDKYSSPLRVGSVFFNILKDDQSDDPVQKLVEFLQVDGKAVRPKEREFAGISHGATE